MTRRTLLVVCTGLAGLALAFAAGAYSESRNAGPVQIWRQLRQLNTPAGGPVFDSFERLVSFPGKTAIPCPAQTPRTEVLLLAGQSNAANHAGQRFASRHGPRIVNYFAGRCYPAESPLLGASGIMGESWTLLANRLIDAGAVDTVILVPAAVYATPISRWTRGGGLHAMLLAVIDDVAARYRITRILWHQGEADFVIGTSEAEYARMFRAMVQSIRERGLWAPIHVSVASAGAFSAGWRPDNPVAQAQRALPLPRDPAGTDAGSVPETTPGGPGAGIFPGVDTDHLLDRLDRYDGVHFAATGQEKFAEAWVGILRRPAITGAAADQ